jgi:glycosyltransferase involved in cell wall biosynthesis
MTVRCLEHAIQKAECEFELLSVDNGSTDKRVVDYIASKNPAYHRVNPDNQGYARMLNQMLLRAKGDYLCVIDNDLLMPDGWLRKLVEVNQCIPDSGISGYHCVLDLANPVIYCGCEVHFQEPIHGVKFFNRAYLDKVGYYCESFHPYGNEDVEMNRRSIMAGFKNYYLGAGDRVVHLGEDSGEQSDYRKMKWDSLHGIAHPALQERFTYLRETGDFYVAPSASSL